MYVKDALKNVYQLFTRQMNCQTENYKGDRWINH